MVLPCKNITAPQTGRKKRPWNKSEEFIIRNATEQWHKVLEAASAASRSVKNQAEQVVSNKIAQAEAVWMNETAGITTLLAKARDPIGGLLASQLGIKTRGVIDPTYTKSLSGAVKNDLLEAARVAENQVAYAAKVEFSSRIGELNNAVNMLGREKGLSADVLQEVTHLVMESGQIPRNRSLYGATPGVDRLLEIQYQTMKKTLLDYGFRDSEINALVDVAGRASSVFEEMRVIANAHGLDIGRLPGLGYVPRIPTSDFLWRMKDFKETEGLLKELQTGRMPLSSVWEKARTTYKYVPEDDIVVARLLGIHNVTDLWDMMADPPKWVDFLDKNVTAEQLDTLVNSGMMSKVPMTSKEVFDYFVKQYDLPYKGLNEMFVLDPHQMVTRYQTGLRDAVRNSAMFRTVAVDGLKAGWAVPAEVVKANPKVYEGFVKLRAMGGRLLDSIPENELAHLDQVYVHPIVARQWKALVDVSASPIQMSNAARAWNYIHTSLNKSTLLSSAPVYIGHVFLSNLISGVAGGMNIMHLIPSYIDTFRAHAGIDFLDNVNKAFKFADGSTFTEREMFKRLLLHRNIDVAPLSGQRISSVKWESINPKNLPGALNYMWHYSNAKGTPWSGERIGRGLQYFGRLAHKALNDMFTPLAAATQQLEFAFKWATVKSIARNGKWQNFEKLLEHIDNHFYMFDDPGKFGAGFSSLVQPFAGYSLQNTPAMMKFMLRSPQKFMAYAHVLQMFNAENVDHNNPPPEAGFKTDDLHRYPITLQHDPNTNEYFTLFPNSYDPITDALSFMDGVSNTVSHVAFGNYTGTSEDMRNQAQGKGSWQDVMNGILEKSYYKGALQFITGYDAYRQEVVKPDDINHKTSYLGVYMSPIARAFLSILPPVDALNRANPGGVFGIKEQRNAYDQTTRPGQPSIFGAQRSDADSNIGDSVSKVPILDMARRVGFSIKTVDVAKNMQASLEDIKTASNDIHGGVVKAQKQLKLDKMQGKVTDEEYAKRSAEIDQAIDTWLQMKWDEGRVRVWMAQNKVPEKDVLTRLKDAQLAASDLPMPGAVKTRELIDEAARLRGLK